MYYNLNNLEVALFLKKFLSIVRSSLSFHVPYRKVELDIKKIEFDLYEVEFGVKKLQNHDNEVFCMMKNVS